MYITIQYVFITSLSAYPNSSPRTCGTVQTILQEFVKQNTWVRRFHFKGNFL